MVKTILSVVISILVGVGIFYNVLVTGNAANAVAACQIAVTVIMGGFIMYTLEKQNKKIDEKMDKEKL